MDTLWILLFAYTMIAAYLAIDLVWASHKDWLDVAVGVLMAITWPFVVLFIIGLFFNDGLKVIQRKIHKGREKADITV